MVIYHKICNSCDSINVNNKRIFKDFNLCFVNINFLQYQVKTNLDVGKEILYLK